MKTIETLKALRLAANYKKQTLKSLRAEFVALVESDSKLSDLEKNHPWCSVGGNGVEQARTTKGFDMFAFNISKIIDILEPFEFDLDDWFSDESEQGEKTIKSQDDRELEIIRALPENEGEKLLLEFEEASLAITALHKADKTQEQQEVIQSAIDNISDTNKERGFEMDRVEELRHINFALDAIGLSIEDLLATKPTPIKAYYSLLTLEGGVWVVAFGDYERDVVEDEKHDSYSDFKAKELKIVKHDDNPAALEEALKKLNGDFKNDG